MAIANPFERLVSCPGKSFFSLSLVRDEVSVGKPSPKCKLTACSWITYTDVALTYIDGRSMMVWSLLEVSKEPGSSRRRPACRGGAQPYRVRWGYGLGRGNDIAKRHASCGSGSAASEEMYNGGRARNGAAERSQVAGECAESAEAAMTGSSNRVTATNRGQQQGGNATRNAEELTSGGGGGDDRLPAEEYGRRLLFTSVDSDDMAAPTRQRDDPTWRWRVVDRRRNRRTSTTSMEVRRSGRDALVRQGLEARKAISILISTYSQARIPTPPHRPTFDGGD
ncbi:hypothetical protein Scep_028537 [Stephania cephalantha]|uniref:Uncharacterized protein n=1 Tax=Stephania cephalantha TaxID=152367 RepID=A0AAP0EA49_9MAGN